VILRWVQLLSLNFPACMCVLLITLERVQHPTQALPALVARASTRHSHPNRSEHVRVVELDSNPESLCVDPTRSEVTVAHIDPANVRVCTTWALAPPSGPGARDEATA
jgi:hypothetical protein